jgi:hypothetical protein
MREAFPEKKQAPPREKKRASPSAEKCKKPSLIRRTEGPPEEESEESRLRRIRSGHP